MVTVIHYRHLMLIMDIGDGDNVRRTTYNSRYGDR